ncbi:MAG: C45 family autoproteolytic acyltransferase/hydrolase [Candidatus Thermoplasmatota archaeon]|nr:C45 family autoproteolytic acyltransferase/hydrolase [Candidatus Thermoplasmatota archaeon]
MRSGSKISFFLAFFTIFIMTSQLPFSTAESVTGEVRPSGGFYWEKEGFKYIQVSGTPDEIGYQHGCLLADLIPISISAYAHATERSYGLKWNQVTLLAMNYWTYVPEEQREEIDGIARGAAENDARDPTGDPVDRWDILALNAIWDIWWRSELSGNPWWWLPFSTDLPKYEPRTPHHCSAFVATGDATADGGFVMAQSLWMPYFLSPAHAVFMDLIPNTGNRIFMEVTAGMIWSGTEFYMNSAGMVISETTLGTGPYQWFGTPSFVRLRKAAQFSDSIDSFKDIMLEQTNGAYCGDYLLADVKTNEVAILELGSYEWELRRTMNGFLPSCNYPWDPEVAEEMGAAREWDHGCYPRWVRLEQLRDRDYGNITVYHGMEYLADHYDTVEEKINPCSHTLCGHVENASGYPHGSLDSKITNRTMASRMEAWARFGHSCGQPFLVEDQKRDNPDYAFDDLVDIIPKPFATFSPFSTMEITIRTSGGEPVPEAVVNLTSTIDGTTFEMMTGPDGVALFEWLPRSEYTINGTSGDMKGSMIHVQDADSSIELVVKGQTGSGILSGGASGIIVFLAIAVVVTVAVMVFVRRKKG